MDEKYKTLLLAIAQTVLELHGRVPVHERNNYIRENLVRAINDIQIDAVQQKQNRDGSL